MNGALNRLVRRVALDPSLLNSLHKEEYTSAFEEDILQLLAFKDLVGLRDRGVHPLLLMQLAGALHIDAMKILGR